MRRWKSPSWSTRKPRLKIEPSGLGADGVNRLALAIGGAKAAGGAHGGEHGVVNVEALGDG